MSGPIRLTDQQLQVVQALGRLGQGSAADVQQALSHLNLAHTTIATVLSRLQKKGVLVSEVHGRERVYSSVIDERDLKESMVSSLVSTLFNGDAKALMAHLVQEGEFAPEELDDLRELIGSHASGIQSGKGGRDRS